VKRVRGLVLAALALGVAVVLSLLAVDVLHRESSFAAGDARYAAGPSARDLWHASEALPFGAARTVLGVDDDLEYRRALLIFERARPRVNILTQFDLPPARAQAEAEVSAAASHEQDPVRKSQLVNLLGALALARAAADTPQSPSILQESAGIFRSAIALDPNNEDAKANLELVLRVRQDQRREERSNSGRPPKSSSRVGLSETGSGY
jgi:hypothetical protein